MSHVNPLLQEISSAYLERKKVHSKNPVPVSSSIISRAIDMHLLCAISKLLPFKDQAEPFDHLSKEELCKEVFAKPALIEDNRAEIEEVIDYIESQSTANDSSALQPLIDNAKRVVLVIPKDDLSNFQENPIAKRYAIKSKKLGERLIYINGVAYPIADSQYLTQQTVGALGTGIFIDENTILTAAHVLFPPFLDLKLEDIRFVVGYKVQSNNKMDEYVSVDKTNVYQADMSASKEGEVEIDYSLSSFGEDWAKIKVVKENGTPNHPYTPITFGSVQANQDVYGLGHGLGLPLKISYCGNVIDAKTEDHPSIFKCTLDFYSGNSGSPIFDSASHELVGIHVRGQREFFFIEEEGKKKVKAAVFSSTKGNIGEECQSVTALMPTV